MHKPTLDSMPRQDSAKNRSLNMVDTFQGGELFDRRIFEVIAARDEKIPVSQEDAVASNGTPHVLRCFVDYRNYLIAVPM
jgi:hypothetical protein